ncbi:hypothetical protein BG011_007447 [Mortierella polycephala]|uniref:Uncharacterized protein n=1 Tax=Mortierella polycephala TaxID=41804 RepID=A0A9P6TXQ1_9FUNG|nr:hypothetical protein BG011_007447 [Mortierella polycephala]
MLSTLFPNVQTSTGLRQFQLLILGLVVIYSLLHLSLYLDGVVHHAYFATDIGSFLHYGFVPATHDLRPVQRLRRRFFILTAIASMWILQPMQLLAIDDSYTLFDSREKLTNYVSKVLAQNQLRTGVELDIAVGDDLALKHYSQSLAAAMQCLNGLCFIIASMTMVEAVSFWYRYRKLVNQEEDASATSPTEKLEDKTEKKKSSKKNK